jgi:hypothetical protein
VRTHILSRVGVAATVALLALGPVAVVGCGGGSSSDSSSTTGTATTYNPHHIPKSAPIASSAYYDALVTGFTQSGHFSQSQAQFVAHCIQKGLQAAGFKTQGESEGPNTRKSFTVISGCTQQATSK